MADVGRKTIKQVKQSGRDLSADNFPRKRPRRLLRHVDSRLPDLCWHGAVSAVTAERNFPGEVRPLRGGSQMDLSWALSIGSFRIRLPVAAKIALATAGITADVPGSPTPPGASVLLTRWTSIKGASWMRNMR
jgi:hypothetical protein